VLRRSHRLTSHILWAISACASLCFEARAAAPSEKVGSPGAAATVGGTAARTSPDRIASAGAGRTNGAVMPQRGASPPAHDGNADRLRSLLGAQARGRTARTAPGVRSSDGAPAVTTAGTLRSGNSLGRPSPPVSRLPAHATASLKVSARDSTIGGSRGAGPGRVGGPAMGRAANGATIDGIHVHRKF
jgi:hypothetical protein